MSSEPGLTLGRLIAAERNAQTGVQLGERAKVDIDALLVRLERLEQKSVQDEQTINRLNAQVYANMGNVRTA